MWTFYGVAITWGSGHVGAGRCARHTVAYRLGMDWFGETYPWIPPRDAAGHELGPGKISLSMVSCRPCPATRDGRGHHIAFCRIDGCRAPEARPDDCSGAYGPMRGEED